MPQPSYQKHPLNSEFIAPKLRLTGKLETCLENKWPPLCPNCLLVILPMNSSWSVLGVIEHDPWGMSAISRQRKIPTQIIDSLEFLPKSFPSLLPCLFRLHPAVECIVSKLMLSLFFQCFSFAATFLHRWGNKTHALRPLCSAGSEVVPIQFRQVCIHIQILSKLQGGMGKKYMETYYLEIQ